MRNLKWQESCHHLRAMTALQDAKSALRFAGFRQADSTGVFDTSLEEIREAALRQLAECEPHSIPGRAVADGMDVTVSGVAQSGYGDSFAGEVLDTACGFHEEGAKVVLSVWGTGVGGGDCAVIGWITSKVKKGEEPGRALNRVLNLVGHEMATAPSSAHATAAIAACGNMEAARE